MTGNLDKRYQSRRQATVATGLFVLLLQAFLPLSLLPLPAGSAPISATQDDGARTVVGLFPGSLCLSADLPEGVRGSFPADGKDAPHQAACLFCLTFCTAMETAPPVSVESVFRARAISRAFGPELGEVADARVESFRPIRGPPVA